MSLNSPLLEPNVVDAIDRDPLIVAPTTPLLTVIELMSQRRGQVCTLEESVQPVQRTQGCSSCALVMAGDELLGIVTERDMVRLAARRLNVASISVSEIMASPVISLAEADFQDVFSALFLFRRYRIRNLVILDGDSSGSLRGNRRLVGVVSQSSLREVVRPANLLKMRRVADVMTQPVVYAFESDSVLAVAKAMADNRVSCVVIIESDPQLDLRNVGLIPLGIITERDLVQFQALRLNLGALQAKEVMSSPLFLLNPQDSLLTAYEAMNKRRVRRLVVSWDWGKGLGIVTQTSLLKIFDPMEMYSVIDSLQQTVRSLEEEVRTLRNRPA
jgi:CBS domain-containing protein